MRALITGVGGFVGSHLAEYLLDEGMTVDGTFRKRWRGRIPARLKRHVKWNVLDFSDPVEAFRSLQWLRLEEFDVIYHLAGLSIPSLCGEKTPSVAAWDCNVEAVRLLLEAVADAPRSPRVVFASSSHVYGPARPGDAPITEDYPTAPRGGYGQSKLAAEEICRQFVERHGLDIVIVRPFPASGPRQDERLMLGSWCWQLLTPSNDPIEVLTLDARIDFSDVRDVVRAYRLLALHGSKGETYHIGGGIPRLSGDVFKLLAQMADVHREVTQSRPGCHFDPIADLSRTTAVTGWQPAIPLETTLRDTLDWYRRGEVG